MNVFSEFCNICYKIGDEYSEEISEENMIHLKDVLITFVGHADIINHNEIYLCQLCREELMRFDKFKEMCFNNLIQLRQTYFTMLLKLELQENTVAAKNTLRRFVHEEVLRRNSLEKSNCSVSVSTEYHKILKSSEDLNKNDSLLNRQIINLQSRMNKSEFDDCTGVSIINSVNVCNETHVAFTNKEDMKNKMIRRSEQIKAEKFESESDEAFYVSDINNANVRNTSHIEFVKEELDLYNQMEKCDSVQFTLKNLGNALGEHANFDVKEPVVNDSEESVYPGIDSIKQELHVPKGNSGVESLELETIEQECDDSINVAFEIATVKIEDCGHEDIRSEEDKVGIKLQTGGCNNKPIAAVINPQPTHPHFGEYCQRRCSTALKPDASKRVNPCAGSHTCTSCNKSFRTNRCLTGNEREDSGGRPYKCTVCNKTYTTSSHLTVHKRTHNGDRPYKCNVCNKAFTQLCSLTAHKRTHSGDRPYKCTLCSKAFTQPFDLTRHERKHSGAKPYKCTVCNKAFTQLGNLTVHERTHNGDKPYKCPMCNKGFTTSSHVTVHKRTHSNDRPFKCTLCNKAFATSTQLTVHGRTHNGDRPFICTVCNKTFTQLYNLTRHKRRHSSDKQFDCL